MNLSKKRTNIPVFDCLCSTENFLINKLSSLDKIYFFNFSIFAETNSFHFSASSLYKPLMLISV